MNNDITELRALLFDQLRALKTGDDAAIARARASSDVAQVIINSARVEIEHVKATGCNSTTGFLSATPEPARSIADLKPSVVHRIG